MLQHFGVTPFLIFDGDYLPSKAATEKERAMRRESSKKAGMELLNAGKASQAYLEFQKAVDVTPEMARQLIDELKKTGIQYIVAPYEADAQMVYLERKGVLNGILSEDSDLLVFGAKCLLTKLDQYGNCIEINKADFCACREISLAGWSDVEFRHMAILSGCDYLASINNMGLKTAYRMIRKHKTIEKVIRILQFDGKHRVPNSYLEDFYQAELTFLHQRVFCPEKLTLVLHTEPDKPIDDSTMPFIGAYVDPEIAQGVACGDLNPMTKKPITVQARSNVAPTSTPLGTSRSQHRNSTSADLKKGKSIDTFFKPKRVPLAELDPNCFQPSPSQRQALNRNSGQWQATPVNPLPRPYLQRSTTQTERISQSAPPPRANTGWTATRSTAISEPRAHKRARLCGDDEVAVEMAETRSRFFSAAAESSPSVGRNLRSKRSRKDSIIIFSEDSFSEATLDYPDVNTLSKPDSPRTLKDIQNSTVNTRFCQKDKLIMGDLVKSQSETPSLTSSSSVTSSAEQPAISSIHNDCTSVIDLKEKYSFGQNGIRNSIDLIHITPTPPSSARQSRIPLAVKSHTSKGPSLAIKASTPLQRLGFTALNRQKLLMTPPLTPASALKHKQLFGKSGPPFPKVKKAMVAQMIDPTSIPLPPADETENIALSGQKGSEDMIIHDSEGDDEALSSSFKDDRPRDKLNLGQFVYAG